MESLQQASEIQPNTARGTQGHRARGGRSSRGRGGRHQRTQPAAGRSQAPAPNPPTSDAPSTARGISPARGTSTARGNSNPDSRSRRGRRGTRGSRRGSSEYSQRTTLAGPRTFGSRLTTNAEAGESDSAGPVGLNVDAPDFIPGQPIVEQGTNTVGGQHVKSKAVRKDSKSTAPDLPTRIHEDISNGQYECVICTNEVLRNSKVWSCSICWTVTHMSCVKKWFSNRTRTSDQQESNWRCPGCNSPLTDEPTTYHCCLEQPAHIHVLSSVMPVPVRRALLWVQVRHVSVANIHLPSDVERPTTLAGGVVTRFAGTYCPAESTNVNKNATRASVGVVRSLSFLAAIAVENLKISLATSVVIS
ncbi:FKBP12-associated protein [Parahypoxylon ruwenzoriense]